MEIFIREKSTVRGRCMVMASYTPRAQLNLMAILKMINSMAVALSTT